MLVSQCQDKNCYEIKIVNYNVNIINLSLKITYDIIIIINWRCMTSQMSGPLTMFARGGSKKSIDSPSAQSTKLSSETNAI